MLSATDEYGANDFDCGDVMCLPNSTWHAMSFRAAATVTLVAKRMNEIIVEHKLDVDPVRQDQRVDMAMLRAFDEIRKNVTSTVESPIGMGDTVLSFATKMPAVYEYLQGVRAPYVPTPEPTPTVPVPAPTETPNDRPSRRSLLEVIAGVAVVGTGVWLVLRGERGG